MGGNKESTNTQRTITQEELNILREQNALQRQSAERGQQLLQPSINRYRALVSGGPAAFREAAPQIGEIDSGYTAAKENIFNTIAPGAARDSALAGLERDRATAKSGFLNDITMGAYDKLAAIGSGDLSYGLQQLGAALRAGEGASYSNQAQMQNETARKAATMNLLGSAIGAGGSVATAGLRPK